MQCVETITAREPAGGLACMHCGCTNEAACDSGCHWVSLKPPVCSACVDRSDLASALESDDLDAGFFSTDRCPASAAPALHAPIYVDETSGYCARCRIGFVA